MSTSERFYGRSAFERLPIIEKKSEMSTVERIALFIDGANLYASAKALGFDIDYKRLLREFQGKAG